MALIELGLIDTNYFNADHVNTIEAAINQCAPAGAVTMTVAAVAPTGWLLLNGQVVANAQTLYPDLWAAAPVGWRVGVTLTLPNMASRFPIGNTATPGTPGSANTKTIAAANLPAHAHSIDHGHGPATVSGTTAGDGAHGHTLAAGNATYVLTDGTGFADAQVSLTGTGGSYVRRTINADFGGFSVNGVGTHTHTFATSATVTPVVGGNSGNGPGTATALDITPAYVTFNFIIKAN